MAKIAPKQNPCMSCGACCAFFRVSFYWREAEPADTEFPVPIELCDETLTALRVMKGTSQKHNPKCVALDGKIGEHVACSIYLNRSTTCRNFKASFEDGVHNPRCDDARAKHGLKPLGREDWAYLNEITEAAKI